MTNKIVDGKTKSKKQKLNHTHSINNPFEGEDSTCVNDVSGDAKLMQGKPANLKEFFYQPDKRDRFRPDILYSGLSYEFSKKLSPVPFLTAQPEGMPCWLVSLDDIKKLTMDQAKVFYSWLRREHRRNVEPVKGKAGTLARCYTW